MVAYPLQQLAAFKADGAAQRFGLRLRTGSSGWTEALPLEGAEGAEELEARPALLRAAVPAWGALYELVARLELLGSEFERTLVGIRVRDLGSGLLKGDPALGTFHELVARWSCSAATSSARWCAHGRAVELSRPRALYGLLAATVGARCALGTFKFGRICFCPNVSK